MAKGGKHYASWHPQDTGNFVQKEYLVVRVFRLFMVSKLRS